MVQITNNTNQNQTINGDKDGKKYLYDIAPGETVEADVDVDSAAVQGRVIAGAITLGSESKGKSAAKSEK